MIKNKLVWQITTFLFFSQVSLIFGQTKFTQNKEILQEIGKINKAFSDSVSLYDYKKDQKLYLEKYGVFYKNKMENHIRPYWGNKLIAKITTEQFEHWVYKVLTKKLSVKTIRDLIMIFRTIWSYWARHEKNRNDPTEFIKLGEKDSEDIDPYTRDEIDIIINSEKDPALKNLWTVMLWS